jgi:hypothetical protein
MRAIFAEPWKYEEIRKHWIPNMTIWFFTSEHILRIQYHWWILQSCFSDRERSTLTKQQEEY